MLVPKTTVHENDLAAGRKYEVRFSWQVLAVQPVAVAHAVDKTANEHFGLGILGADAAHSLASLGSC